ncbi:MAG TPA: hypothetical protein VGG02_12550 [Chthoniobacterales bacterium]|jgi:hypothetical protein
MRSKLLLYILASICLISVNVRATDLRGRVDGFNPFTHTSGPFPGIGVALFAVLPNGSFTIVRQAATGPDGMYYFTGVYPGQYVLQVGGVNYPLTVGAVPNQDIPIINR